MPGNMIYKTDEMLHQERRNFLLNKIRGYFFGASLEDSMKEIKRLYDEALKEQEALIVANAKNPKIKEIKEEISSAKNNLMRRYKALQDIALKLKVENPKNPEDYITNDDMEHLRMNLKPHLVISKRPNKGASEDVLNTFLNNLFTTVENRCDYEADNHYDVPFADQMLRKKWIDQIQKQYYDSIETDNPYGVVFKEEGEDFLENIGRIVTKLYKGEMVLEGLKLYDYAVDPDAPQKTAKELYKACGRLAFLSQANRQNYLRIQHRDASEISKEYKEYMDVDKYHELDKKYDMSKMWSIYKGKRRGFITGSYKDSPKDYPDFSDLEDTLENTNKSKLPPQAKFTAEDNLLKEYHEHLLKEEPFDAIVKNWKSQPLGLDARNMEEVIAAHLCSAFYKLDRNEKNSKELLQFNHIVSKPVNEKTIDDTIDFLKNCLFKDYENNSINGNNLLEKLNKKNIMMKYNANILNREKKQILKTEIGVNDDYSAYKEAMHKLITEREIYDKPTMISRMTAGDSNIYDPWKQFFIDQIYYNKDLHDALNKHFDELDDNFGKNRSDVELAERFMQDYNEQYGIKEADQESKISAYNEKVEDLHQIFVSELSNEEQFKSFRTNLKNKIANDGHYKNGEDGPSWQTEWNNLQERFKVSGNVLADVAESEKSHQDFLNSAEFQTEKQRLDAVEKEALQNAKKSDDELTEQFNTITGAVQDVKPQISKESVLDTLVKGIGGNKDVTKAREKLTSLAKGAKRNFLQVFFRISRNVTATALRNGLNKLANLKEGEKISKAEIMDLRMKALELKSSIAQGRTYSEKEKWVKDLWDVDKARYKMADTIIKNTNKMLEDEKSIYKKGVEDFSKKPQDAPLIK